MSCHKSIFNSAVLAGLALSLAGYASSYMQAEAYERPGQQKLYNSFEDQRIAEDAVNEADTAKPHIRSKRHASADLSDHWESWKLQYIRSKRHASADLSDHWEAWKLQYGLSGSDSSSSRGGVTNRDQLSAPGGDADNDGFTNMEEYFAHSDPTDSKSIPGDTDGDGLNDEWQKKYDITDPDAE